MMATYPRIGVVGTGWWATRAHIPTLLGYEKCQLAALADSDPERLTRASSHFGVSRTFHSAEEMFASGEIDGVVVAVPHQQHYPIARAALEHGIHVLVEKPMTLRAADAWDLVRLADQHDLHLLVGYTHQYTAAARRCREAVQCGAIGELLMVSGEYDSVTEAYYRGHVTAHEGVFAAALNFPRPETYSDPSVAGGGQAQTQLSHAVGMAMWTTGQRAEQVFALMHDHDLAVDLVTVLSARLVGDTIMTIASTGSLHPQQPGQKVLRYYGTEGLMIQDLHAGTLWVHRNGAPGETVEQDVDDTVEPAGRPARVLVDLIVGQAHNPAPALTSAHAVECIEAAYRSRSLGRPVSIHELERIPGHRRRNKRSAVDMERTATDM